MKKWQGQWLIMTKHRRGFDYVVFAGLIIFWVMNKHLRCTLIDHQMYMCGCKNKHIRINCSYRYISIGVGGMRPKNGSIFKTLWLYSFSMAFRCLSKVQKEFFKFSHFWRFAAPKTIDIWLQTVNLKKKLIFFGILRFWGLNIMKRVTFLI